MELNRKDALEMATELGIDFKKTAKTTALVGMINELTGKEYSYDNGKGETEKIVDTNKTDEDTVFCMIHSNDRDNDETEVVGSVNGETYQVLIGEEINFPKRFLPSLNNAVMEVKTAILDEAGQPTGKYRERKVKRYVLERL